MKPFDVLDSGRMAVIADPTGAVLGLWQGKEHLGFGLVNEPGWVDWNELMTPEVDQARDFYTDLFGWDVQGYEMPGGSTYMVFRVGEDKSSVGGAQKNPEGMKNVPPHWTLYFNVADCDAAVAKVKELGGQVYFGPRFLETVGKFAPAQTHREQRLP